MVIDKSKGILFMCVANSARSQMAEGIARQLSTESTCIFSAGSTPATVNPFAIEAMSEMEIDISRHSSKALAAIPMDQVDYVITLCAEEVCPYLPAKIETLHWPYPDPAAPGLSQAETRASFRSVRNALKDRLTRFLATEGLLAEVPINHE